MLVTVVVVAAKANVPSTPNFPTKYAPCFIRTVFIAAVLLRNRAPFIIERIDNDIIGIALFFIVTKTLAIIDISYHLNLI